MSDSDLRANPMQYCESPVREWCGSTGVYEQKPSSSSDTGGSVSKGSTMYAINLQILQQWGRVKHLKITSN